MNIAVILAGGVGNRLGAGIPKQFVQILGKPILSYTIEPFEKHPDVDAILVVCVKPYVNYIWELKEKYGFEKLRWVTEGGSTFQESVMNGVNFLADKARPDDTVLFHFGASPFIKPEIIADVIRVCKEKNSNAISTTDYLLLSGRKKTTNTVLDPENYTVEYINRDTIAVMNTPHAFQYSFIVDMYKEAVETGIIDTVEPHTTTLMYAMGKPIYFSKGSQGNIKITTKEDLEMFEGYVLEQQRKSEEQISGDVIVFLADGFEECEGLLVVDIIRRAGLKVCMASVMGRRDVKSSHEVLVHADCLAENVDYDKAKMIVLPGGRDGIENLSNSEIVKEQCGLFAQSKYIAVALEMSSIIEGLTPVNGNIMTGQGLGLTIPFALKLVEILAGADTAKRISDEICYK